MTHFLAIGPWQIIIILAFVFLMFLPTLIALVDVLRNDFKDNNKLIWVLVILFGSLIGAILYFALGREHKLPRNS